MPEKTTYTEIARVAIKDNRDLVLSKTNYGHYILAQQLGLSDGQNKINIYLKGAIHFESDEALLNARDMLAMAIDAIGIDNHSEIKNVNEVDSGEEEAYAGVIEEPISEIPGE